MKRGLLFAAAIVVVTASSLLAVTRPPPSPEEQGCRPGEVCDVTGEPSSTRAPIFFGGLLIAFGLVVGGFLADPPPSEQHQ